MVGQSKRSSDFRILCGRFSTALIVSSPSTVPPHNPNFVGRRTDVWLAEHYRVSRRHIQIYCAKHGIPPAPHASDTHHAWTAADEQLLGPCPTATLRGDCEFPETRKRIGGRSKAFRRSVGSQPSDGRRSGLPAWGNNPITFCPPSGVVYRRQCGTSANLTDRSERWAKAAAALAAYEAAWHAGDEPRALM